jgi:CubicO group peptidase (beta-lactamase class C family)
MMPLRWFPSAAVLLLLAAAPDSSASEATLRKVQAALPELEKLAEQALKQTGVPGMAVAVVCDDRVVYLKGFGVRRVGHDEPVDADTVFQLASVSKPIASTVVAALVGEGVVRWDDHVCDLDPGFRLSDPWVTRHLTLRDLLCHRSGLPDHAGDLLEDLGYDRAQVLHRLRYLRPLGGFRSHYAYTNFGYTEAAVAAARAAGKSWEDLAAEKLFRPLGMRSTSYRFADYAAAANRARLHVRDGERWVARFTREPDAQAPAGGASSTARDMALWLRLQLGGGKFGGKQVVAAAALAETHRPQIVREPPEDPAKDRAGFYGLGWNVGYDDRGRVHLGHSGAFSLGAATTVELLPAEGVGIAVLTNTFPIGVPEAVAVSFLDLVQDGKVQRDWLDFYQKVLAEMVRQSYGKVADYHKPPAHPSPALPAAAYVGTYGNDYYGDVEVAADGDNLVLHLGPRKTPLPLRHWDRDVFVYQPTGENAAGPSGVTFLVGPGPRAVKLVVEALDVHGQGTFVRAGAEK